MLKQRVHSIKFLLTIFFLLMGVSVQAAITVSIETNPDPVAQSESIQTAITVGNTGVSSSGEMTVKLKYPEHLRVLSNSLISDGGTCPGNNSCDTAEFLTWTLGSLAQGSSITLTLPAFVQPATPEGTLIAFDVEVFEDGDNVAMASRSVVVQSAPVFDIAVDEDLNPVAPGGLLTYTITYGNRSTLSSTNTVLSFPLPVGVSFVSASGDGALNNGVVQWNLQTFPSGRGGRQTVTVDVNSSVVQGSLLEVDAVTISGQANLVDHSARALATTRVENNIPVVLSVKQQGQVFDL